MVWVIVGKRQQPLSTAKIAFVDDSRETSHALIVDYLIERKED